MDGACRENSNQCQEHKCENKSCTVINRETDPAPFVPTPVSRRTRLASKHLRSYGRDKIDPHAEQGEPGEELDDGKLPHGLRHGKNAAHNLPEHVLHAATLITHLLKCFKILRRILLGRSNGVENG